MSREEFFYLLPYLISLGLSLGVFIYAWQHRRARGVRAYTWFVAGQTLTIAGFIFELLSPALQTKLLWDKFQWLTDSFLVFIPFLVFALHFSEHKLRYPRLTWSVWLSIPILFTLLLLTDSLHHLIYPNPHLSTDYPFPELKYNFTVVIYIYSLTYLYGVNLYGVILLFRRGLESHNPYRSQFMTIAIGFLLPLLLTIFSLAEIRITPQRDITPFSLALGNLIVAWGLFRYRLFDIVPIAREQIVENIADPVVVLDAANRIVDINPAALKLLGRSSTEMIGLVSNEAFARWPVLVSELEHLNIERREIAIRDDDDTFFYDLKISSIYNTSRQMIGRILVAHDITRHKTLESGYRILSEELEQRVKERTDELRHIAERYRAVVENQTEFIVRWKPDGTRTFVNEAYLRYWGITLEDALAVNFFSHIAEEDRPGVEKNTTSLLAGTLNAITETHRVVKPDGSVGWQEWTDQAVRDANGQIVEFQSVGRDVTERKQAEKALRENEEKLRTLFNILPVGISILDKDRQITEMNPRLQEILKIPAKELFGGKPQQRKYIKSDGTPVPAEEFPSTRAFKEQKQVLNNELGILKDDGEIIWVNVSAAPLPGFGVVATTTDITERKRAEEALRESEAIYRKAIEVAGAVPYRQSYPGREFHIDYEFIGDGIRQITGYGPEEFHEDLWDKLVQESHPAGDLAQYSWREAIQRVRTGASPVWQCEHRIQARNGETRWVYEAAVELRDSDGKSHGSIGMFQDITERKQAEDTILKQLAFDKLMNRLLAQFATCSYDEVDSSIGIALREITEHLGGDFANILFLSDDHKSWVSSYRWMTTQPTQLNHPTQTIPAGKLLWSEGKLLKGESVIITSLDDYPVEAAAERQLGEAEGVRSLLSVPIRGRIQSVSGVIDIVAYQHPIQWSDSDVTHLRLIGDAIANLLERKRAEQALRSSEERFSKAFQESPIGITITQIRDTKLLEVNDTFEKIFGYSREEVIGKTITELGIWANWADRERLMPTLLADGKVRNEEVQYWTKSGKSLTCLLSAELIELGSEKCVLAVIEDITERKKSELRILHLNRLYVTISQINQTIVHASDRDGLFSEICRVAIEHGQFRMAWIGLLDAQTEKIMPLVFAGEELGYLDGLDVKYNDKLLARGPTGTAIREGHCVICQDIANDPRMAPWREQALSRDYRSSAAVPIREQGRVIGALTVYSNEVNGFDSENEELLEQIGQDVSFALDSLQAETERTRAEENLEEAYDTTLEGWAKALELRDKETEGHSRRVTETTLAVARAMDFSEAEIVHIRRGSILHDIGKMGIPDQILRKEGPLTDEERQIVLKHPDTAYNLLKQISFLEKALEIPYSHHEKWDGTGYPRGLKGEEIPLSARIFAIVDVWDALSSDRPYRKAWAREKVVEYLKNDIGKHFDPRVADVFLAMVEKGEI